MNNLGISGAAPALEITDEQWQRYWDVTVMAAVRLIRTTLPGMKERGWGRIVNIGSINGQAGQYGQVNYAAAKSGIHGFTKALAQEGARSGVTVNALAPGYIDTDMVAAVPQEVLGKIIAKIPVNRLGKAELTHGQFLDVDAVLARIRAVTAEQVQAVAVDLLARPRSVTVVGPFDDDSAFTGVVQ